MVERRDPRRDPRAGDILRDTTMIREVECRDGDVIIYLQGNRGRMLCSIESWRTWAHIAEVIVREPE